MANILFACAVGMGTGISENTIAVSCSQPEFLPGQSLWLTLGKKDPQLIAYLPQNMVTFPETVVDYDIWVPDYDLFEYDQACRPLPADTPDLSKKVVLIRQAACAQQTQQDFLDAFGAQYILFYNDDLIVDYQLDLPIAVGPSQLGTTLTAVAQLVIPELKSGGTAKLTAPSGFTAAGIYGGPNYSGYTCSYGSWGPMYDLDIKPDILAPGDRILSTWLYNSYAVVSGTAQSTAYMAGVAALYIGQNPSRRRDQSLSQVSQTSRQVINRPNSQQPGFPEPHSIKWYNYTVGESIRPDNIRECECHCRSNWSWYY
jgi:hypothetical protein